MFVVFFHVLPFLCLGPYVAAMAFLVVEAFAGPRHVEVGAYEVIQWASHIPYFRKSCARERIF